MKKSLKRTALAAGFVLILSACNGPTIIADSSTFIITVDVIKGVPVYGTRLAKIPKSTKRVVFVMRSEDQFHLGPPNPNWAPFVTSVWKTGDATQQPIKTALDDQRRWLSVDITAASKERFNWQIVWKNCIDGSATVCTRPEGGGGGGGSMVID